MSVEQQRCGNCGALNPGDAVVCVNCGTVLAAHAPISAPEAPPPKPVEPPKATTSTQATQRGSDWRDLFGEVNAVTSKPLDYLASTPTASPGETPPASAAGQNPSKPTERGSDWRDLFAHAPGAERKALDFSSLPAAPALPDPPAIGGAPVSGPNASPVETTSAGAETCSGAVEASLEEVSAQVPAPAHQNRRSIPVATYYPSDVLSSTWSARLDRQLSNRSPQSLILYGIMIFVLGCVIAMILSATGASDTLVALLFICAGPLGLIMLVIGIILAVARREGRQR